MILIFDTETTGLPKNWNLPPSELSNWPRLVQLAYKLFDSDGNIQSQNNFIIKPDGFIIPGVSTKIHKISTELAKKDGIEIQTVLKKFKKQINKSDYIVCHSLNFDENVMASEFIRYFNENPFDNKSKICTMVSSTEYCGIRNAQGLKYPKLSELHFKLFKSTFEDAHNAEKDVEITSKCFWELVKLNIIQIKKKNKELKKSLGNKKPQDCYLYQKLLDEAELDTLKSLPKKDANLSAIAYFKSLTPLIGFMTIEICDSKKELPTFKKIESSEIFIKILKPYHYALKQAIFDKDYKKFINEVNWILKLNKKDILKYFNIDYSTSKGKESFDKFRNTLKIHFETSNIYYSRLKQNMEILTSLKNEMFGEKKEKEGCYIATMVYDNYDHENVILLRNFRDGKLKKSKLGLLFIKIYYRFSPTLVKHIGNINYLKKLIKIILEFTIIKILKTTHNTGNRCTSS